MNHPKPIPTEGAEARAIGDLARDVTLKASIERIARKAHIMTLDATRSSVARQDAEEIALLAGIALRCIERAEG